MKKLVLNAFALVPRLHLVMRPATTSTRISQVATRRQGTLKGGYVAKKEEGDLELIILAAGSEVQHAISAAETLGKGVRVVSVPSMYRFDKQSAEYKEEVLPSSCTKRVAMEVRPCFFFVVGCLMFPPGIGLLSFFILFLFVNGKCEISCVICLARCTSYA